jgi:SAM-dependent methyltransferase
MEARLEAGLTEALFDLSDEYEAMLNQGIRLSGESMFFFLEGRLGLLREQMQARGRTVSRVLDFGCGLGYSSQRLREMFAPAEVTGVDTSVRALESARQRNGGTGVQFTTLGELKEDAGAYDLCYVNGVFHHIPLPERPAAIRLIHRVLNPGGILAVFENNPWNLGARMVMARIPFDRNAHMLSPLMTQRLLRAEGFEILHTGSLFFFPRALKALRSLERPLGRTRLGAQYLVLARKRPDRNQQA